MKQFLFFHLISSGVDAPVPLFYQSINLSCIKFFFVLSHTHSTFCWASSSSVNCLFPRCCYNGLGHKQLIFLYECFSSSFAQKTRTTARCTSTVQSFSTIAILETALLMCVNTTQYELKMIKLCVVTIYLYNSQVSVTILSHTICIYGLLNDLLSYTVLLTLNWSFQMY